MLSCLRQASCLNSSQKPLPINADVASLGPRQHVPVLEHPSAGPFRIEPCRRDPLDHFDPAFNGSLNEKKRFLKGTTLTAVPVNRPVGLTSHNVPEGAAAERTFLPTRLSQRFVQPLPLAQPCCYR